MTLEARLAPLLAAHALIQTEMQPLLASLKDTTIPLDERWDAFTQLIENNILVSETTNTDGYLGEFFGRDRVSLYDDFYMDRNQSRTFPEIWERILEGDDLDVYGDLTKRDQWRERVLASGYSGFEYDW